jgi:hypothetical protein
MASVAKRRVAILTNTVRDPYFTGRAPQAHRPNQSSVSDEAQRSEPADAETG